MHTGEPLRLHRPVRRWGAGNGVQLQADVGSVSSQAGTQHIKAEMRCGRARGPATALGGWPLGRYRSPELTLLY